MALTPELLREAALLCNAMAPASIVTASPITYTCLARLLADAATELEALTETRRLLRKDVDRLDTENIRLSRELSRFATQNAILALDGQEMKASLDASRRLTALYAERKTRLEQTIQKALDVLGDSNERACAN